MQLIPLIQIRNMHKIYNPGENAVHALDSINLDIYKGESVSIVGQSGSGKSTLMNMIGCLDTPTKGSYLLDGCDVYGMSDNQLSDFRNKAIGFIFQGFNLVNNLDALGNVELPLIYRGVSRRLRQNIAKDALRKVGLGDRMKHKPSELSGGQQQRVAIARAIAAKPPIILADEPTGNLDTKSSKEVMDILTMLNQSGHTIILITHNEGIAKQSKRIIRIVDGRIDTDYENDFGGDV